jgi:hypothetical protein
MEEELRRYEQIVFGSPTHDEVFLACMKCGDLAEKLGHSENEIVTWYLRAYSTLPRADPLVKLGYIYRAKKQFHTAFMFLKMAAILDVPNPPPDNMDAYTYQRWHLIGATAFFIGRGNPLLTKEGLDACVNAISAKGKDIDRRNKRFYTGEIPSSTHEEPEVEKM